MNEKLFFNHHRPSFCTSRDPIQYTGRRPLDYGGCNKSLYGLKQSPQCWNTALDGHLKQLGFKQSKNDACIYTRVSNKGLSIIVVYVDNIIIASDCLDEINEVKSCLSAKYKMKDFGKLSYFLGVSVMQTKNEVFLEQSAYTKALLSRFGMDKANSVATPVDVNADLVITSDEVEECDKDLYQIAVDADWAGDRSDRKSTSGYCFTLSTSVITWRSVKQSCVALSTAEAEYVALAGAAQEAIWLKQLLDDLEFKTGGPMVVNEDDQSAICLAQNPKYHGRSKHIDIKFHYVRDLVRKKETDLVYCPSNDMLDDIFTKGLSAEKFSRLRSKLGVVSFEKHI
ncbi:Reverse transcriptase RNA-dependent DNA polymerase [Trinorchestia longiramus]|nr:Reverse transcriptase RNA-dependent DNA polymerase [Trinorchestia longiramus]